MSIPADWLPGDVLLFSENLPDEDARKTWGGRFVSLTEYWAVIRMNPTSGRGRDPRLERGEIRQ